MMLAKRAPNIAKDQKVSRQNNEKALFSVLTDLIRRPHSLKTDRSGLANTSRLWTVA